MPGIQTNQARVPEGRNRRLLDLFEGHFPGHTMQRVRSPDGVYRYTYVSPGVKHTFGLDPEIFQAKAGVSHDWLHEEDRQRFVAALERSAARLETLDEEVRLQLPDGSVKWVRSIGHPKRLDDGSVVWDGVALDVSDRHDSLEALRQQLSASRRDETSWGRLAAIAAGDIEAPLETLRLKIDELEKRWHLPGEAVKELRQAYSELEHSLWTAFGFLGARSSSGDTGDAPATLPQTTALTLRQAEVLQLVRAGHTNKAIASELRISEGTAKLHVSAILKRLRLRSRRDL